MTHSKADYDITIKQMSNGNVYLIIYDLNKGNVSVTNDMQNILLDVFEMSPWLKQANIIYRDSEGVFDGIKLIENGFEFYSIGKKFEYEAIERVELINLED